MRVSTVQSSCRSYIAVYLAILWTIHEIRREPLKHTRLHSFGFGLTDTRLSASDDRQYYASGLSWPIPDLGCRSLSTSDLESFRGIWGSHIRDTCSKYLIEVSMRPLEERST